MGSCKNVILTMSTESSPVDGIGVLVLGPPFLIVYVNEHARRIIGSLRADVSGGDRGLPRDIMKFCRDACVLATKIRRRKEPAFLHLHRAVALATTPLRLRAVVMPVDAPCVRSHILILIEKFSFNRAVIGHAAKELSPCSPDHEPKSFSSCS